MTNLKLLALSALGFTMALAFYRGYKDYENAQETDHLLLANIEALAQDEEIPCYINDTNLVAVQSSKSEQMRMVFLFHGNELVICYNIL